MSFDYAAARALMVEGQIRPNRVTTPALLDQMEALPREEFVAPGQQGQAYREGEVEVARGRYLLAPMVFARMVEALHLTAEDRVLDLACASGYSTAVLAALAGHVIGLESDTALANIAARHIETRSIGNATIQHGPFSLGMPQHAPFSAILVNGAVTEAPQALLAQLAEGGRLVAIVGGGDGRLGQVTLFEKFHNTISQRVLFEASASYLPGFAPVEGFSF